MNGPTNKGSQRQMQAFSRTTTLLVQRKVAQPPSLLSLLLNTNSIKFISLKCLREELFQFLNLQMISYKSLFLTLKMFLSFKKHVVIECTIYNPTRCTQVFSCRALLSCQSRKVQRQNANDSSHVSSHPIILCPMSAVLLP